MYFLLALNSWSSCIFTLSAGIPGMCYLIQVSFIFWFLQHCRWMSSRSLALHNHNSEGYVPSYLYLAFYMFLFPYKKWKGSSTKWFLHLLTAGTHCRTLQVYNPSSLIWIDISGFVFSLFHDKLAQVKALFPYWYEQSPDKSTLQKEGLFWL